MTAIVIWVIGIMFTWGVLFGHEDEEVGWKIGGAIIAISLWPLFLGLVWKEKPDD